MSTDVKRALTPYILVVEDEDALATLLQYNLEKEGYGVDLCADGEEALIRIDEKQPDLVVLDWMLPTVSGIEVCRRLRQRPETRNLPIIMLTARGEETDRIRGLDTGADDYIVKPFSMSELTARDPRRAAPHPPGPGRGPRPPRRHRHRPRRPPGEARRHGRPPRAHRVPPARLFHAAPGRVFSREQLLDAVWGSDVYVETRTVDVHIGRLRRALGGVTGPDPIRTVRSAGYSLNP